MSVQTDLKAGTGCCYKCGSLITLDLDIRIDLTLFGPKKRHGGC